MSVTVTMSLTEYEAMKEEIERLRKKKIDNFLDKKWIDMASNDYQVTIDVKAIVEYATNVYKHGKIVTENEIIEETKFYADDELMMISISESTPRS
jgi:hypothetical protein